MELPVYNPESVIIYRMSVHVAVHVYCSMLKSLPMTQPVGNESSCTACSCGVGRHNRLCAGGHISDRSWRWQQVMKFVSGSHHVPEESAANVLSTLVQRLHSRHRPVMPCDTRGPCAQHGGFFSEQTL